MERHASSFARGWACCAVLDLAATVFLWINSDAVSLALGVVVLVAAGATATRPSTSRLTVLASLWAAHILYHFPVVPNHNVALAAMNLTIAIATLSLLARRRRWSVPLADAQEAYAPVVRLQLVVLYALAALHKLNWDYLNPGVSCAPSMAREIAGKLGLPFPSAVGALVIWGSLALEIGIPLLLSFARTRRAGVALGLPFHLILSLDSVIPILGFSATVYCVYILFLPEDVAQRILDGVWLPKGRRARALGIAAALAVSVVLAAVVQPHNQDPSSIFPLPPPAPPLPALVSVGGAIVLRTLWHVMAAAALVAFGRALASDVARAGRSRSPGVPRAARTWPQPALLVFPLLIVANGAAPYLGVKTIPCFSMFSNLSTEGGATNHVFITPHRLLSGEDDLLEIVDSSSARLRAAAARNVRIPYFELRRLLSGEDRRASAFLVGGTEEARAPDFWFAFRRNGRTAHVSRAETPDDPLFQPHGWLAPKLLAFRLMASADRPLSCAW